MPSTISQQLFHLALNPFITGILLAITNPPRYPTWLRFGRLLTLSSTTSPSDDAYPVLSALLKCLFAVGAVLRLNAFMNELARNSWRWRPPRLSEAQRWKWEEEVAIVTGGCSGIGEAVVQRLAARGIRVAVLDIQELPRSLADNPKVSFHRCDIASSDAISAAAAAIRSALGPPSILINNAGIGAGHTILKTKPEFLRKIFDVNLLSHFHLIQAILPDMITAGKGHIVAVASMASFVSSPGMVDYSCAKVGVLALHDGLVQELRHSYPAPAANVQASIVHPAFVRTPMLRMPTGRSPLLLEPEEVADAIVAQVLSGKGAQIILPAWLGWASTIRGWPTWMQVFINGMSRRGAAGVD